LAEIDTFAAQLLEEAKSFLEKARSVTNVTSRQAYLHAALNLVFCSLEAHLNSIADDFLTLSDLSPHERSILSERKVEIEDGEFRLTNQLQIFRLEDRLLFLCARFSKAGPLDRAAPYWAQFKQALLLRNGLTHPKEPVVITEESVERALSAVLEVLDVAYRGLYKRPYPGRKRGLTSAIALDD
jgi:hypothetical protein